MSITPKTTPTLNDLLNELHPATAAILRDWDTLQRVGGAHLPRITERSPDYWRDKKTWPCGCFVWADHSRIDLCPYHDGYNDARCEADEETREEVRRGVEQQFRAILLRIALNELRQAHKAIANCDHTAFQLHRLESRMLRTEAANE